MVSIREVFSGPTGPENKALQFSSQTRHHFTQADQVNLLVSASEADPDLGFMARMLVLCSLPRTNPGNRLQYKRQNGPFTPLHGRRRYADRPVVVWSAAYRLPLRSSPATIVALASMAWILSTSVSNGFSARTMKSASKPAFMAPISSSNPSCAAPLTV